MGWGCGHPKCACGTSVQEERLLLQSDYVYETVLLENAALGQQGLVEQLPFQQRGSGAEWGL